MQTHKYDLVIIGGGQAGLAAAYYAQQSNLNYIVLEAQATIGQSWRNRYDSLTLFTPRKYSELPGISLIGDEDGYPTKDELSDYLQKYAKHFDLNVTLNQPVHAVTKEGNIFHITTPRASYESKSVIVATGPFQTPRIPTWHDKLTIPHMHSSDYRNPTQAVGKKVLVVGGGNSGAQIAEELAKDHNVTIATMGRMRFIPAKILGKSLFWWLDHTGLLNASTNSFGAKLLRKKGDPIIGINLKALIKHGKLTLKPAATGGRDDVITFADGTSTTFDTVVWATGYTLDYSWLKIPGALDDTASPLQSSGVAVNVKGLYFLGLSWMRSRNSALLGGVGHDAQYILSHINND